MNKFNARAARAFGALGAAITFLPLAGFILFAAGMIDCQDCGLPPDAFGALFFAAALATLFGVVTGSASAWLKRYTGDLIGRSLGTAGLTIVIVALAFPTIWVAPKLYGYVTYLRTPTDQLPPSDARRTLSDCAKRARVPEVVCAH